MTLAYAMLLDGGCLRYELGRAKSPIDAAGITAFTAQVSALPCLRGMRLHRIYFYDSKPLQSTESKPLGAQLVLITLGHGTREGLREHADIVIDKLPSLLPS